METKNLLNKKITQWLLLVAMIVGCSANTFAASIKGVPIYFTPNGSWAQDGAQFEMHCWGSVDEYISMTLVSGSGGSAVYVAMSNNANTGLQFVRGNGSGTRWNYSKDLTYDGSKNYWTKNNDWGNDGSWGTKTNTYYVTGNGSGKGNWCGGTDWTVNGSKMSGTPASITFNDVEANDDLEFKVTVGSWGAAWGHTYYDSSCSSGIEESDKEGNVKLKITQKSNITITFNGSKICVTAVAACTPPSITSHPSTTGATYCQGVTATALSVVASGTATLSYQWKQCSTSGGTYTDISGATSSSYTPSTATAGTTYYKCYVSNSCGNATSNASGAITVNAAPTITSSTGDTRCGTGTVTLSATASSGTVKWYSAATDGTFLGSGNSYTTPSIASTKTYYAEADDNGCVSTSRTAVVATVITRPAAPISSGDISVCYGSNAEFKATQANSRCIDWYTASTGGEKLETCQTTYTKANLTSDYTVYAEARIADNGCISASRTAIKATVKALNNVSNISFSSSSVKKGDKPTATATVTTDGGTGAWSTSTPSLISFSSTSDNPTTITANGIGTAKVTYTLTNGCNDTSKGAVNSKTVDLVINSDCDVPSAGTISGDQVICAGSSVSLSVTDYTSTNTTLQWNKNGNPVAGKTSNTYIESDVTESATYTVTVTRTDVENCSNTTSGYNVNVTQIPSITAQGGERCGNGEVTLQATATPVGCTVNWYDAATGGTKQGTGLGKEVNVTVGSPVTLYAEAVTTDAAACKSASRASATATAKLVPSIASVTKTDDACGDGDITFTANGVTASSQIEWFENSVSVGTGGSKTFSGVPAGTSHTVTAKATLNGCESAETTPVTGTRKANPSLTIGVTSSAITAGEIDKTYGWEYATFTASSSTDGATVTGGITQTTEATVGKAGIIEGNKAKGHVGDAFTGSYTATGTNGCTTSDSKTVTVIKATEDCSK